MSILNDAWVENLFASDEYKNNNEWKNTSTNMPPQGELVEVKRWDRKTQTTVIQDAWLDFNDCWTDETGKIIKQQYVKWWRYI